MVNNKPINIFLNNKYTKWITKQNQTNFTDIKVDRKLKKIILVRLFPTCAYNKKIQNM